MSGAWATSLSLTYIIAQYAQNVNETLDFFSVLLYNGMNQKKGAKHESERSSTEKSSYAAKAK